MSPRVPYFGLSGGRVSPRMTTQLCRKRLPLGTECHDKPREQRGEGQRDDATSWDTSAQEMELIDITTNI
jgi:hypothetical protein